VVRELLAAGADVFAANWCGKTPLVLAREYAPPATVAMLAEAEQQKRRPPPPRLQGPGIRADREQFLQQLLAEHPLPPSNAQGSSVEQPQAG
jgi:hypothetical protein